MSEVSEILAEIDVLQTTVSWQQQVLVNALLDRVKALLESHAVIEIDTAKASETVALQEIVEKVCEELTDTDQDEDFIKQSKSQRAKERTMLFLKNQYPSLNDDELSTFIDGDTYAGHK